MRERVKHLAKCTMGYGHIGDGWLVDKLNHFIGFSYVGNLHLNVVGDCHSLELLNLIEPFLFDWTGMI